MKRPIKFAFIAALEREIQPLLNGCERATISVPEDGKMSTGSESSGQAQTAFFLKDAVLLCSGPGYRNAYRTARLAMEAFSPEALVSIGFAGALSPDLKVGDVFVPRHIISERTGSQFTTSRGRGRLVTAESVAGEEQKRALFLRTHAQAVDMEAAAVAEMAVARGCEFVALKAISDALDSKVCFVSSFVKPQGFRVGAFLAYVSVRPWLWPAVRSLQRHSLRASNNLCHAVRALTTQGLGALEEFYPETAPARFLSAAEQPGKGS